MDNPARLWLRVDEDVKRRATEKATEEGQDLTTALRELVAAYADGRVTIRRGRR
jgi:antitoxin component of RelBE/YafQ-DinJ toxin-antitoxin module